MNFSDPAKNIAYLGLREGMHVADFGSGSGAYSLAASARVGSSGRVVAIDVQKDLLERLDRQARESGARNLEVLWGDIDEPGGSKLAAQSEDAVVIGNVLFQSEHKNVLIEEAKRVLKPGGGVLVVDWADSFGGLGPQQSAVVTKDAAKQFFTGKGFVFETEFPAGEHHYGLIFRKPATNSNKGMGSFTPMSIS